jgi:hypothetical protein
MSANSNSPRQAPVSYEMVAQAAEMLAAEGAEEEEVERQLIIFTGDELLADRLQAWIREIFGRVLLQDGGHWIDYGDTFSVRAKDGKSVHLPYRVEPLAELAARLARDCLSQGRREFVVRIASQSASLRAALHAINQGVSLEGARSATAFGIPAEAYWAAEDDSLGVEGASSAP